MSDGELETHWEQLRGARRSALVPYLTAGFPSPTVTRAALDMVVEEGADLLELGLPFSEPLADGPVLQRASHGALAAGMTVRRALDLLREARPAVPVILFGYCNPVLAYGLARFLDDAGDAGAAGLLLTDLPAGEDPAVEATVRASPLALIPLVAPTTPAARCERIVRHARGFVYVMARTGVTGARTDPGADLRDTVTRVRRATRLPIVVGFGIASGAQAAAVARVADGVVVGSALVQRLERGLEAARDLMRELRASLDDAVERPSGAA